MKKNVPADAVLIPETATRAFNGIMYDVYQWQQSLFDGTQTTFEMLRRADTVQVLAVVDAKLLILDEEQSHRGKRLSLPGGRVESGEDTLAAAQRELLEETGYQFRQWRLVRVSQPQTKIEWFVYLFVAWDIAHIGPNNLDGGERIRLEQLSLAKLQQRMQHDTRALAWLGDFLANVRTTDDLLALPEFQGKEIDR